MPPAATVKFGDEEKTYPCDAHREPGEQAVVRFATLLGVFEGEVIVTSVEADMVHGITSRLIGAGMLRFVEPAP